MKNRREPKHVLAALCAGAFLLAPIVAQDKGVDKKPEEPALPEDLFPADDPREEMIRLFHEVERKLIDIDIQLADAGAGDVALEEVGSSGIEKLLRNSSSQSRQVVEDIDRILELAEQMGGT